MVYFNSPVNYEAAHKFPIVGDKACYIVWVKLLSTYGPRRLEIICWNKKNHTTHLSKGTESQRPPKALRSSGYLNYIKIIHRAISGLLQVRYLSSESSFVLDSYIYVVTNQNLTIYWNNIVHNWMICKLCLSEYKILKIQFLVDDYICVKFDGTMTANQ